MGKSELLQQPIQTTNSSRSHLVNNGVEESPPDDGDRDVSASARKAETGATTAEPKPNPHDLFVDLTDTNVGFSHWHPTPVTSDGQRLRGQSDMGGLWEWTSTAIAAHPGFKTMDLYPGYTADFFDGKHNIILGGSWATVPRIAGRKSFVNWYQRNYPYTWATARLVRDV
jgi:L-histidine Nalpha-methyltransferase / hercynylcysteine S-oxide synthase